MTMTQKEPKKASIVKPARDSTPNKEVEENEPSDNIIAEANNTQPQLFLSPPPRELFQEDLYDTNKHQETDSAELWNRENSDAFAHFHSIHGHEHCSFDHDDIAHQ